jgi:hypothetical protein
MNIPAATPAAIPSSVTVCITSCGRLDLLAETIASFRAFNTGGHYLLSEDSTDAAVIAEVIHRYPEIKVLSGPDRLGLMASIDRLCSAVQTPFIFHLEDDWMFDGPVDWIAATGLLQSREKVSNVLVRPFEEIKPKFRAHSDSVVYAGREFRIMHQDAHPENHGWSSSPGLIRKSLYERYKPFARMRHDQMSAAVKKGGQTLAYLLPGVAHHIGRGRNVGESGAPARPKSRPAKWLRSIKKKLYYAGLRKEPF